MQPEPHHHPVRILHLEDSALDHDLVLRTLRKSGMRFDIVRVERLDDFLQALKSTVFDVVLADYRLPGFTALDAWNAVQDHALAPPFILLSGAIGESAAVEAIKLGINDYLLKDDMAKLAHVIQRTIEVHEARLDKERAVAELAASEQRLAQFADHLQMTIEHERAAIAREIHDDIGGSLAAIKFDLSWLGRRHTDSESEQHIASATSMLQHAIGASQRIMLNLHPAILDQGLEAAVDWLVAEFERRSAIKTVFRSTLADTDISRNIKLAAYRTAQEALTNVAKHAQCTEVRVELSDAEGVLTLEITDNGRGIQPDERNKARAFGLKGLQERARTIGGWMDISSRSGQGTSITLTVPLSAQTGQDMPSSLP
jgi:signal transduction histidine kinase